MAIVTFSENLVKFGHAAVLFEVKISAKTYLALINSLEED